MSTNEIELLFVAGLIILYSAAVLPVGRVWALAGVGLVIYALCKGCAYPIRPAGPAVLAVAGLLLLMEFLSKYNHLPGIAAALLMPMAFLCLYAAPQRVSPGVAIPAGLVFGFATNWVVGLARRARLNKRSDL